MTVEALSSLSSNGYNKFVEKLTQMSSRKLYSRIPTTLEQLLKLPVPEPLAELMNALTDEGISSDVLIHSFYSALLQHSGHSSLSEKLISKLMAFLKEELTAADEVERIRNALDELWDQKASGVDRYDIPVFLRRAAD